MVATSNEGLASTAMGASGAVVWALASNPAKSVAKVKQRQRIGPKLNMYGTVIRLISYVNTASLRQIGQHAALLGFFAEVDDLGVEEFGGEGFGEGVDGGLLLGGERT